MPKALEAKITNEYSFGEFKVVEVELDAAYEERHKKSRQLIDILRNLDVENFIAYSRRYFGVNYKSKVAALYAMHDTRARRGKTLRKYLTEGEIRISKRWIKEHHIKDDDPDFDEGVRELWE